MKHRWRLLFLKIVMIATLLLSLGGILTSQTAHAGTCDAQGAFSICAITSGSVTVVRPTLSCSMGGNLGGSIDIMQGCNGSNWEKIGFSNFMGIQEWVQRYGWTYSGTGDNYRYFTFNNYAFQQVDDTSTWWIEYSDGNETNNNCYGGGHSCDYNAWQNYILDWNSPQAQLRDWVTTGRPANQTFIPLEYPQPGLASCQGSQTGATGNVSFSLGFGTTGGNVGITGSSNYQYYLDGQCNAGGPDAYSTYMNLNWGGVTCTLGVCTVHSTQSPISFLDVTSFNGPNNANGRAFWQGWNLTVNWWYKPVQGTVETDLHTVQGGGPNGNFAQDKWSY